MRTTLLTTGVLAAALTMAGCSTGGSGEAPNAAGLDSSDVLTQSQLQDLRAASLRRAAADMGVQHPPQVDLVRWTDLSDYAPTMVKCLGGLGFTATAVGGAGLSSGTVPEGQDAAYGAAMYTCTAKYTIHPYYNLQPSADALGKMYDWYANVSAPCLRSHGVDVPEAPTRETWVAEYQSSKPSWLPWNSVPGQESGGEASNWERLERACPQAPAPGIYLEHPPSIRR